MTAEFTPGQHIGDYEILSILGAGGMGKVYKVRNVISDRIEAMKILLPDLHSNQSLADRFLREIRLLATLNHPNIAALRTALTHENQLVMIMEFVEGETLSNRIARAPISTSEAVNYADQVLSALSYAHKQNIIHRDIKPANMMLTPQGVVKLMDFGIARSSTDGTLTSTGTTLGSLNYMPPEQVRGESADARSDIYSFGISLYELLTGKLPFHSDSQYSLMTAHLNEVPAPPITLRDDLPASLNEIIMMAMAKDPAERFQSADAFRAALKSVPVSPLPFAGTTVTPTPKPGTTPKPSSATTLVETHPITPLLVLLSIFAYCSDFICWRSDLWFRVVAGCRDGTRACGSRRTEKARCGMNFDYGTVKTTVAQIFGSDQDVGKGISDLLVQKLVQDGKYSVIERNALDKILAEQNFSNSDRADSATAAKIGKILGIDCIIIGSITQFGRDDQHTNVGGGGYGLGRFGIGGVGTSKAKAVVGVSARMINTSTGEILVAVTGTGESTRSSTALLGGGGGWSGGGGGSLDMGSSNFSNTILGEAVHKAVDDTGAQLDASVDKIPTVKMEISGLVADVSGNTLIINVGKKSGVHVGDKLIVTRQVRTVKDPATGKVIKSVEDKVGEATVTEADNDSATVTYSGSGPAKVGDVVKNP